MSKTRIDIDAFIKAFKAYHVRKYNPSYTDKEVNQALRKFIEEVSNSAGNPQVFDSLIRRYKMMLAEFNTVFNEFSKYSPTFMKESKGIKDEEYKYSIADVLKLTEIESRTAIKNRAENKDVDCIEKKMPSGRVKHLFSEKGLYELTNIIKPRPGGQKKNKI